MSWNKEEELLRSNVGKSLDELMKLLPNKTRGAIRVKRYRLGYGR